MAAEPPGSPHSSLAVPDRFRSSSEGELCCVIYRGRLQSVYAGGLEFTYGFKCSLLSPELRNNRALMKALR